MVRAFESETKSIHRATDEPASPQLAWFSLAILVAGAVFYLLAGSKLYPFWTSITLAIIFSVVSVLSGIGGTVLGFIEKGSRSKVSLAMCIFSTVVAIGISAKSVNAYFDAKEGEELLKELRDQ